jgi:hypothetical protein
VAGALTLENDRVTGEEHLLRIAASGYGTRQPDGAPHVTDEDPGELWRVTPLG